MTHTQIPNIESQTPVHILTGFLGSGKTTLLARLVRDPSFSDTAVIVNEFGEVGLDHLLVTKGEEDDVVLLDSGCLCCTLNNSLAETLTDLFYRRARGEIPAFTRIVVETTGIADPAPMMHTLMTDRLLARRYSLAAVIACVDAFAFDREFGKFPEVAKQISLADRLIITKTDAVDTAATNHVGDRLCVLNPQAEILLSANADIDPRRLMSPVPASVRREMIDHDAHDHAHGHGDDNGGYQTFFMAVDSPVSWSTYAAFISFLQRNLCDRLLRVKGLLMIEGEPLPQAIQGVQHVFAPPHEVKIGNDVRLGLIFIGLDLNRNDFTRAQEILTKTGSEDAQKG